jgi:hypothetical protein
MIRKESHGPLEEALEFLGWGKPGGARALPGLVPGPPVAIRAIAALLSILVRLTRRHVVGEIDRPRGRSGRGEGDLHMPDGAEWTDSRIVSLCLSAPESSRPEDVGLLSALVAHRRPGAPLEENPWIPFDPRPLPKGDAPAPSGPPGAGPGDLPRGP